MDGSFVGKNQFVDDNNILRDEYNLKVSERIYTFPELLINGEPYRVSIYYFTIFIIILG